MNNRRLWLGRGPGSRGANPVIVSVQQDRSLENLFGQRRRHNDTRRPKRQRLYAARLIQVFVKVNYSGLAKGFVL